MIIACVSALISFMLDQGVKFLTDLRSALHLDFDEYGGTVALNLVAEIVRFSSCCFCCFCYSCCDCGDVVVVAFAVADPVAAVASIAVAVVAIWLLLPLL